MNAPFEPSARTAPRCHPVVAVAAGAAAGAVLRAILTELPGSDRSPLATVAINVAGCLLLGMLPALVDAMRHPTTALALGPGLLGGFTTVSAWAEDVRRLLVDEGAGLAGVYLVGTLVACLAAAAIGRRVAARRRTAERVST